MVVDFHVFFELIENPHKIYFIPSYFYCYIPFKPYDKMAKKNLKEIDYLDLKKLDKWDKNFVLTERKEWLEFQRDQDKREIRAICVKKNFRKWYKNQKLKKEIRIHPQNKD